MLQRDHIMRQIQQATQVIQHLLQLKESGRYEEARDEVDEALRALTERNDDLSELAREDVAATCEGRDGSFSTELAVTLAELLEQRGAICAELGDEAEACASWRHALGLYERSLEAENAALPWDVGARLERLRDRLERC